MSSEHSQPTSETHTGGKTSRVKQAILEQVRTTVLNLEADYRRLQFLLDNSFFENSYFERIIRTDLALVKKDLNSFNLIAEQLQQELS